MPGLWEWIIEYDDGPGYTYVLHKRCQDGWVCEGDTVEDVVNMIASHNCSDGE